MGSVCSAGLMHLSPGRGADGAGLHLLLEGRAKGAGPQVFAEGLADG